MPLLGDPLPAIDTAEDRGKFGLVLDELGIRAPRWGVADGRGRGARGRATASATRCSCAPTTCSAGRGCASAATTTPTPSRSARAVPRRPVPRGRARARRRRPLRRRVGWVAGHPRAHRAGRDPLRRLGLRDPRAVGHGGARGRDPRDRRRASRAARRARTPQPPARPLDGRQPADDRGEPARVPNGSVRGQGDRRAARRPRLPADARRAASPTSTCPTAPGRRGRGRRRRSSRRTASRAPPIALPRCARPAR